MLNTDAILKRANALYNQRKIDRGYPPAPGISFAIQSDQVKAIAEALVEAMNAELAKMNLPPVGKQIVAALHPVADVVGQPMKQQPELQEPGPVKIMAVDTKSGKTECIEAPGAKGTTVRA